MDFIKIKDFIKKNYIYFVIGIVLIIFILAVISCSKAEATSSDITIIGDSRMVGLCSYVWYQEDNGTCIAKEAIGYAWFVNTAIGKVNKLDDDRKVNIAINLGVNDLYNVNNYIKKYQDLATDEWKESNIYIVSVNPTKGAYDKLNKEIDAFNERIEDELSSYSNIYYCDTNSYLKKHGFNTSDGLHYDNKTSKKIYEQIKECIY